MTRVTNGVATKKRRKRVLKQTRGFFGNKSRLFRYAHDAVLRAGAFAFRDRRKKKTVFRQLWIVRINAACRAANINYSRFMNGLKKLNIGLDRKQLSELAMRNEIGFNQLVEQVKKGLV
ncbi:MAG: 50S ribosomal protein L20 [Puniceicoccales bacterium]|jgi:large subunit ribosomal protein L20|nr:50S ribosomal protein L20 [Puniceicoccales bacterium]